MNFSLLNRNDHQGAKGPIIIGDELLVYKRDKNTDHFPGYWDFPGGGKDKSETVFQTFSRETKEEFGLTIKMEDIVFVKQYPSTRFPGELVYFIVAKIPKSEKRNITFGDEGTQLGFMGINDYLASDKSVPYLKERLKKYLKEIK